MNQDSAAAARYGQEVYIHVLEKLVRMADDENKTFGLEMNHIAQQNDLLHEKVQALQNQIAELDELDAGQALEWDKVKDPLLAARFLDLIASEPAVNAQTDFGVQPARAV